MSNRKLLVVDGQVFQTPAWDRGMGKYSLELLAALDALNSRSKHWSEIEILLSAKLKISPEIEREINERVPTATITRLNLLPNYIDSRPIADKNRKVIDSHLKNKAVTEDKTDYVILSLMQGEIAPAFPSSSKVHKAVLFYDVIPLMFHETYLTNPLTRTEYLTKIAELFQADTYFSISKTVANDLIRYLGVDKSRVVDIDGGPIDLGHKAEPLGVPKPFILMPTGNDLRKNNRRGIFGFSEFNKRHENRYSLVITSFFKRFEIEELQKLAPNILFTGNVSGGRLNYLYGQADALLFPSEYEGLGLPILEALEKNKPVACSNISVFREMSETAFHYFNPQSASDIAKTLDETISNPDLDTKAYGEILRKYQWPRSAQIFVDRFMNTSQVDTTQIPKVALFLPDPAENDFGAVIQSASSELDRIADSHFFIGPMRDKKEQRVNYLPYIKESEMLVQGFSLKPAVYDGMVYGIANTEMCTEVMLVALAQPGVVLLEDTNLENLWEALRAQNLISKERFEAEAKLEDLFGVSGSNGLVSLVARQKTVVVFHERTKKIVCQIADKVNKKLQVIQIDKPSAQLAYPEIETQADPARKHGSNSYKNFVVKVISLV